MKYISPIFAVWAVIAAVQYVAQPSLAADKLNTAYISTTPGSSTVIQVAKEMRLFDKYGIDATVIFISGSVRGIQSILAGEIPLGEGGGPDSRARGWRAATSSRSPATSTCCPIIW